MGALGFWWAPIALMAVLAMVRLVLLFIERGAPVRMHRGRVTGVVGRMGSGKTLYMMGRARAHLAAGGHVAVNGTLDLAAAGVSQGSYTPFTGWNELAYMKPGTLVLLDEAHMYAPALSGFRLPGIARWYLSMARKLNHEVIWATQHEKRVSESLRIQTSHMVKCQAVGGVVHRAKYGEPDTFGTASWKPWWVEWYRRKPNVCALYDTYQLVLADESVDKDGEIAAAIAWHAERGLKLETLDEVDADLAAIPRCVTTSSGTRKVA